MTVAWITYFVACLILLDGKSGGVLADPTFHFTFGGRHRGIQYAGDDPTRVEVEPGAWLLGPAPLFAAYGPIRSFAAATSEPLLLTSNLGHLVLWNCQERSPLATLPFDGATQRILMNSDGSKAAVVYVDAGAVGARLMILDCGSDPLRVIVDIALPPTADPAYHWGAMARSGDEIAVSSLDQVNVWSMATGKPIRTLPMPSPVFAIAYGKDDGTFVVAERSRIIRVDALTGKDVGEVVKRTVPPMLSSFDVWSQHDQLVLCEQRGRLAVYGLDRSTHGDLAACLRRHQSVFRARFSPCGQYLAITDFPTGGDGTKPRLVVYETATTEVIREIDALPRPVLDLCFTSDSSEILVQLFGQSGLSAIGRANPGTVRGGTDHFIGVPRVMAFSGDGDRIVVGTSLGGASRLEVQTGQSELLPLTGSIIALAAARGASDMFLMDQLGTIYQFDLDQGQIRRQLSLGTEMSASPVDSIEAWVTGDDISKQERYRVSQFQLSHDGQRLLVGRVGLSTRVAAFVWDTLNPRRQIRRVFENVHESTPHVVSLVVSPDGSRCVVAASGVMKYYDIERDMPLGSFAVPQASYEILCWHRPQSEVMICKFDEELCWVELATGDVDPISRVRNHPPYPRRVLGAFSGNGNSFVMVVNGERQAVLTLIDCTSQKVIWEREVGLKEVTALTINHDGRFVALGAPTGQLLLWDVTVVR